MATFDNIAQEKSKVKVCDRCHQEAPLKTIRVRRIERTDGAASCGMVTLHYCEACLLKNKQNDKTAVLPSSKQLKNMLRSAKKELL